MIKKVIYGFKHAPIGVDEFFLKCPSCEKHSWADAMIISKYSHFYWIPFFPIDKELNSICQECGLKRYGLPFESSFVSNFSEIQKKFRHPWYTYIGVGVIVLVILCGIIVAVSESP